MKSQDLCLLSWRKAWLIVVGWSLLVVLHNAVYALFGIEEAFFFILAIIVMPIYVLIAAIYSLVYLLRKPKKKSPRKSRRR